MASGVGKAQVLHMYKSLLRESQKFPNYNFKRGQAVSSKNYAFRKVRDEFKSSKALTDTAQIKKSFAYAQENLLLIRRQVTIGNMYSTEKLVIENQR